MEQNLFKNIYFYYMFVALLLVSALLFIDISRQELSTPMDYDYEEESDFNGSVIVLENFLTAKVQPKDGKNIFFLDTIRIKHKKPRLFTPRQQCAVESAGKLAD